MPEVLTTKTDISCLHGGKGTTTPSEPIWSVEGGFVVVENDEGHLAGCSSNLQCDSYVLQSMGLNATKIRGKKVILVTDFNLTNTGLPLIIINAIHDVVDDSSPAPLVDGQPPPPLSPAMADELPPVVTCPTPLVPFSLASPSPAAAPQTVTFTLTSAHPMKWMLMLVNEPGATQLDLTNATPPGVTIDPLGGSWDVSPLPIEMTLELTFLNTLLAGEHRFYMTAINQRGLSHTFVLLLTVTP